jgi:hypothetical protein
MEKQKVPIINILLANGVQSKFRDSDVPPLKGPHHVNEGQIFDEGLELSTQNTTAYKHTLIGTSVFFVVEWRSWRRSWGHRRWFVC